MRWRPPPLRRIRGRCWGGWGGVSIITSAGFGIGYIGVGDDGCYVTRRVMTPYGYRLRTVNVCY